MTLSCQKILRALLRISGIATVSSRLPGSRRGFRISLAVFDILEDVLLHFITRDMSRQERRKRGGHSKHFTLKLCSKCVSIGRNGMFKDWRRCRLDQVGQFTYRALPIRELSNWTDTWTELNCTKTSQLKASECQGSSKALTTASVEHFLKTLNEK